MINVTTFKEFSMAEALPRADIFSAIFKMFVGRRDVALFGAHAVNVYVEPPRMTEDIDVMATGGEAFAEEVRALLARDFHIAVRVRKAGQGFRVYQLRDDAHGGNRHLVDVRPVAKLPDTKVERGVQVVVPAELIAMKVRSFVARRNKEKGLSDELDLHRLLNALPKLRSIYGEVRERLVIAGATSEVIATWERFVVERRDAEGEDEDW